MAIDWDSLVVGPCMTVFGENIFYTSQAGTLCITGVFNEAYIDIAPLGHGGLASESPGWGLPGVISSAMPVLGVQLSQFIVPPAQGDLLNVRDTAYVVKEVRADGQGGALLLLNQYAD